MLRNPRVSPEVACAHSGKAILSTAQPALAPRAVEQLLRIKGDLRLGLPVILQDGSAQIMVALIESLSEDRYAAMTALGTPELVLTRRRAEALGAPLPIDDDSLRLRVPVGASLSWLAAIAGNAAGEAVHGDAVGPMLEAATPAQSAAIRLAKSTQVMMPAVLSVSVTGDLKTAGLIAMPVCTVLEALDAARPQELVSSARLPTAASQAGRVHVFRPDDGGAEHYAIEIGTPKFDQPVTVRLHSACFTGDVLGSLKCDCGSQLRSAMQAMGGREGGVLLYLNQEGRGIGMANKMRAYALQETGLDTVEANHWLGFEDDQRDFRMGALILRRMGIRRVRLMTNNPAKLSILVSHGIDVVERIPLQVGHTTQNAQYLATKAAKSGHLL